MSMLSAQCDKLRAMAESVGELVRCKDCKWACVPDDDGGYGDCVLACAW